MRGIAAFGVYLPYFRLRREHIAAALGTPAAGGTRSVASYDEDTTSMAVEAARNALGVNPQDPAAVYFATAQPAYLDKTNATAIHAALRLGGDVAALDLGGALRSGVGALRAALEGTHPVLVLASDLRTGRPGSEEEAGGGDGAAALLVADDRDRPVAAEFLAAGSATEEFMDRWRLPGDATAQAWEERFATAVYPDLAQRAITDALKAAALTLDDVDHVVVAGTHARSVATVRRLAGDRAVPDPAGLIGNTGTAHALLLLAGTLEQAEPGKVVLLVSVQDGADALVFRTTDAVRRIRPRATLAALLARTSEELDYARYLTWRGFLERQPPRRPDPQRPAAPPSYRSAGWKFGFVGSRDRRSGAVHLPPQQVSYQGGAVGEMDPLPMADQLGRITTFTVDRLAFTLSPPVVVGVVDFHDGMGRFQGELTDVDPDAVRIGDEVELTFRRLYTAAGTHNYFWKARPVRLSAKEA